MPGCNNQHRKTGLQHLQQLSSFKPVGSDLAVVRSPCARMDLLPPSVRIEFTSPYHRFCKANRPTLPTHLKNSERERLLGEMWNSLGKDGREAFKSGLVQQLHTRRGGTRAWQLAFDYRQETAAAAPLRPSRPAPALPAPLPNRAKAVEQLGNSEEELDKLLQEQLSRIRGTWSQEVHQTSLLA